MQIAAFVLLVRTPAVFADVTNLPVGPVVDSGHGSVSLTFQTIEVSEFNNGERDVDIGSVSTRSAFIELEYAFSSRWRFQLGIPYIRKAYDGPGRHDPLRLDPPRPEVPYLDDGLWHGSLQDLSLGLHFLWARQQTFIEPFAALYVPSHDYPHFAQAAVGQNLWKFEMGAEVTHFMAFSDWYYRASGSYTLVEKTLGVNVDHFRLSGELGYFLAPSLAVHGVVQAKLGNGDDGTAFPPSLRTDERWYQHDRTSRHSYVNTGLGADWFLNENYQFSAGVLTTVWGRTVHKADYALSIGITRYF